MKLKYQSTEKNIDEIAKALDNHQITLLKDISLLDQMYELNEDYYLSLIHIFLLKLLGEFQHLFYLQK